jgi:hypothetical protein
MLLFSEYNARSVASTSIGNYTQQTRFTTLESEVFLGWPQYGSLGGSIPTASYIAVSA